MVNSASFWFAAVVKFQKKALVQFQKGNKKNYVILIRDKDYSGEQHMLGGNIDHVFMIKGGDHESPPMAAH